MKAQAYELKQPRTNPTTQLPVNPVHYDRQLIMSVAWLWHRDGMKFSEAVSLSWKAYKLNLVKELMHSYVVHFSYLKASDKSVRFARGTTVSELFADSGSGLSSRSKSDKVCNYFDLDAVDFKTGSVGAWRSFKVENLLKIVGVKPYEFAPLLAVTA